MSGQAVSTDGALHRFQQLLLAERFGEKFHGTRLHGADGHGNIGMTGDKDYWKVHVCLRQFLLEIKTAQVGEADIEDDTTRYIGTFRAQKFARRSKVPSFEA